MFTSCASQAAALIGARYLSAQRAASKRRDGISLADGRTLINSISKQAESAYATGEINIEHKFS